MPPIEGIEACEALHRTRPVGGGKFILEKSPSLVEGARLEIV